MKSAGRNKSTDEFIGRLDVRAQTEVEQRVLAMIGNCVIDVGVNAIAQIAFVITDKANSGLTKREHERLVQLLEKTGSAFESRLDK